MLTVFLMGLVNLSELSERRKDLSKTDNLKQQCSCGEEEENREHSARREEWFSTESLLWGPQGAGEKTLDHVLISQIDPEAGIQ